jgi:hypothetical protein
VAERIDYVHGLTDQFPPRGRWIVVYCSAARETGGAVLDTADGLETSIGESMFSLAGLAAEHQVYWYATDSKAEAFYLSAWVNSGAVDEAVRPRAMWGPYRERHIEKRIVEIGPPRFSASDPAHTELAALGEQAAGVVAALAPTLRLRSLGAARGIVRRHPTVAPLLARIDELARQIAGL